MNPVSLTGGWYGVQIEDAGCWSAELERVIDDTGSGFRVGMPGILTACHLPEQPNRLRGP